MPANAPARSAYKGLLIALREELTTTAEAAIAATRAEERDAGLQFWAQALMPEVDRQLSKLAAVKAPAVREATQGRRLAPDDPLRALTIEVRAASADAERTRKARRAWSQVDGEIEQRLAAAEQRIRDLERENARLRGEVDSVVPWTDTGRDYPAEWDN